MTVAILEVLFTLAFSLPFFHNSLTSELVRAGQRITLWLHGC